MSINLKNVKNEDVVVEMLGNNVSQSNLVILCERLNTAFKASIEENREQVDKYIAADGHPATENVLNIEFTPAYVISAYDKNRYFLKIVNSILWDDGIGYVLEDLVDYQFVKQTKKTMLDLQITDIQVEQCNEMTSKRKNCIFHRDVVERLLSSDLSFFIDSFDQSIDDTYNRSEFFERAEMT